MMTHRNMSLNDYQDFSLGEILDILSDISSLESPTNNTQNKYDSDVITDPEAVVAFLKA